MIVNQEPIRYALEQNNTIIIILHMLVGVNNYEKPV